MKFRMWAIDHKPRLINGLILGMFVMICLITVSEATTKQILAQTDFLFHMNRIETFRQAIEAHQWFTFRAFSTANQIGVANNYFYPYVYIWLSAWTYVVVGNPIMAYYINVFILMFCGLLIAYWCSLRMTKSKYQSLLIAIFYMTTPYHVFILNVNSVLGEAIAYTFIPLFFLGSYELLKASNRRWWVISIALALTLYAHIITFALEVLLLAVIFVVTLFKNKNWQYRLLNGVKAAVLFGLMTAFFWVPFIQEYFRSPMQGTTRIAHVMYMSDLGSLVEAMISSNGVNGLAPNPGIIVLGSALIGIVYWKKVSQSYKLLLVGGVTLLVASTSLFPWYGLPVAFQNVIQFPYRLYGLVCFTILLAGSEALKIGVNGRRISVNQRWKLVTGLCFVGLLIYGSMIKTTYQICSEQIPYTPTRPLTLKNAFNVRFRLDRQNYQALFNSPRKYFGTIDYAPIGAWKGNNQDTLITHQVMSGHRKIKSQMKSNVSEITYKFHLKQTKLVDIPVLHYGNERVVLNEQKVTATTSVRGGTQVRAKRGENTVVISEPVPSSFILLVGLAVLSWVAIPIMLLYPKKLSMGKGKFTK